MITIYGVISDKRESHLKAEKWVFRTILLIITIKFRKFEICPNICTEPQSLIIIIIIIIIRKLLTPKLLSQCHVSREANEVWGKFCK